MISPPKFSTVARRHNLALNNCDYELGRLRHCDRVLVLDSNTAPWKEFFVRAEVITPDSDWRLFALDYTNKLDVIVYGNDRIPFFILANLLKQNGLVINIYKDVCFYRNQIT